MKIFENGKLVENTRSVKNHVPAYKGKFAYKGRYENQLGVNKALLIVIAILLGLLFAGFIGAEKRYKHDIEALQRQNMIGLTMSNEYSILTDNLLDDILKSYSLPTDPTEVIKFVFGENAPTMTKIAKCESGLNPNAKNKTSTARGLFQIMSSVHGVQEKWLYNPMVNALIAKQLYDRQGTTPWSSSRQCWQ